MPQQDDEHDLADEQGVSLDALSEAFAQVLGGRRAAPAEESVAAEPATGPAPGTADDLPDLRQGQPADDDPCELSPRTIFEAMLFVGCPGNEPLTAPRAAELMRGVEPAEIPDLVAELNARYDEAGCPYHIVSEGAGYRLALRPEHRALRDIFHGRTREAKLSQAAVDVLAIVAYRQPITADEVQQLRGTPSGALLSQMVRRRLLRIERTNEKPRRTLYYTTDRFLDLFGLNSLDDLPQSEELEGR